MGHLKTFMGEYWMNLPSIKKYGHVLKFSLKFSFFCFQDNGYWWVWFMQQQFPGKLDIKKLWAYDIFTLKQVDKKG